MLITYTLIYILYYIMLMKYIIYIKYLLTHMIKIGVSFFYFLKMSLHCNK
jgi:hypothetical protein